MQDQQDRRHGSIHVEPVSGALGAVVSGIDLRALDDALFSQIHSALLDHLVLFFRDQDLSPQRYSALARRFGAMANYPFARGMDGHPEITEIVKEPHQTSNFGGMWHTDTTYIPAPPIITMLYAVETPSAGGDTLFANMYKAYESLSDGMRGLLDSLHAVNSSALHAAELRADHLETGAMRAEADCAEQIAEHPAVRTHPETGRKALYVNPSHTVRFATMTREESAPILNFLFSHSVQPEFTCRFRWAPGSLAIWDNRCTQHAAINDYDGHRRIMRRIIIEGDRPE